MSYPAEVLEHFLQREARRPKTIEPGEYHVKVEGVIPETGRLILNLPDGKRIIINTQG
jgi:hypothetical protein